jgi:dUTP pyrophosphatase
MRGFQKISSQIANKAVQLPKRQTTHAAGYDMYTPQDIRIPSQETVFIHTGIKAYMQEDEVLYLYMRSSMAIKKGLVLANQVGVIDSDYYNNESNEGEIIIALRNTSNADIEIATGERIAQGVFQKFLKVSDEKEQMETRVGGIGSTQK